LRTRRFLDRVAKVGETRKGYPVAVTWVVLSREISEILRLDRQFKCTRGLGIAIEKETGAVPIEEALLPKRRTAAVEIGDNPEDLARPESREADPVESGLVWPHPAKFGRVRAGERTVGRRGVRRGRATRDEVPGGRVDFKEERRCVDRRRSCHQSF
jgi:hypothetical protein